MFAILHESNQNLYKRGESVVVVAVATLWRPLSACWRSYHRWNANRIALLSLRDLDDRLLTDIGLSRCLIELAVDRRLDLENGVVRILSKADAESKTILGPTYRRASQIFQASVPKGRRQS